MINIILNSLITETLIPYILIIISILISVAFMTVFERQLLGALQRRQGPNVVGFFGLFQALTDGLKLLLKAFLHGSFGLYFLFLVPDF